MTDERLALIVRAAMRGMMEALLDDQRPLVAAPPPYPEPRPVEPPEEIAFPSVTAAEETLFGETPPPTLNQMAFSGDFPPADLDLDAALAARARARAQQEQDARPAVQGGPGEKDVAEWLRLPNV